MPLPVRRSFIRRLFAGGGLLLLAGCAGLPLGLEKPGVSIAGIRLLDGNLFEQRFVLALRITNPNRVEIPIEGLNFDLDLNERPFAKGVSNRALVVPRLGEATMEVTVSTGLNAWLKQLGELGKGRDKADYRIRGRLVTGNFGGFDFDRRGQVDLLRLLGRFGERLEKGTEKGTGKGDDPAPPPSERF